MSDHVFKAIHIIYMYVSSLKKYLKKTHLQRWYPACFVTSVTIYNLIIICKTKTSASSSREPEKKKKNQTSHTITNGPCCWGGGGGGGGGGMWGKKVNKSLILRNRILERQALVTSATWQLPSQSKWQLSVNQSQVWVTVTQAIWLPVPVHGYYSFTTLIVSSALIPPTQAIYSNSLKQKY